MSFIVSGRYDSSAYSLRPEDPLMLAYEDQTERMIL